MTNHTLNNENDHIVKKNHIREDFPETEHFKAATSPELVKTPGARYISILGNGAPGTDVFYKKKNFIADIASKISDENQDSDPVIEILYWYPEGAKEVNIKDFYSINPTSSLNYRIMARINDGIEWKDIEKAYSSVDRSADIESEELKIFTHLEQLVVQVLHVGPFAEEFNTLERLEKTADSYDVRRSGPHQEIHLDSFERNTPQDTLRTILRDPVNK